LELRFFFSTINSMSEKHYPQAYPTEVNFFVYGTLKRGQCRERIWPRSPMVVEEAWVLGELYDAGSYPALFPGTEKVLGEIWSFPQSDFDAIVKVLDDVEEYRPGDPYNLYNRELIDCETLTGRRTVAYTYLYARKHDLPTFTRIVADEQSEFAQWHSGR
jgi:gamma-glutamylcyclotransferase (GGCT)/AIG2-like uncharacterized protein YtfP